MYRKTAPFGRGSVRAGIAGSGLCELRGCSTKLSLRSCLAPVLTICTQPDIAVVVGDLEPIVRVKPFEPNHLARPNGFDRLPTFPRIAAVENGAVGIRCEHH